MVCENYFNYSNDLFQNIKKLLKIPYSKNNVSMMVHRVGDTLLLDDFDIHKHLLRKQETDWEWMRKFFYENVMESVRAENAKVRLSFIEFNI